MTYLWVLIYLLKHWLQFRLKKTFWSAFRFTSKHPALKRHQRLWTKWCYSILRTWPLEAAADDHSPPRHWHYSLCYSTSRMLESTSVTVSEWPEAGSRQKPCSWPRGLGQRDQRPIFFADLQRCCSWWRPTCQAILAFEVLWKKSRINCIFVLIFKILSSETKTFGIEWLN